jgi:hypothetical protein
LSAINDSTPPTIKLRGTQKKVLMQSGEMWKGGRGKEIEVMLMAPPPSLRLKSDRGFVRGDRQETAKKATIQKMSVSSTE